MSTMHGHKTACSCSSTSSSSTLNDSSSTHSAGVVYLGSYVDIHVIDSAPWVSGSDAQFACSAYRVPARTSVAELAGCLRDGEGWSVAEVFEGADGSWERGISVDCGKEGKKDIGALGWTERAVQVGGPILLVMYKEK